MNVMVVGGGGREHAIAWKAACSGKVEKVYCAPGNGGTAAENKCENINIKPSDFAKLADFAKKNNIELTIVGPEDPLVEGIVDFFEARGLKVFGPCSEAAQIEASKAFAKDVMDKAGIPTAEYQRFTDYNEALAYVDKKGVPIVIKADGLAAGKGVTVAFERQEARGALKNILVDKIFGESGSSVVIEEYLNGEEASYLAFTDGNTILPLQSSQDHKPVFDGDKGPNTGGMGAYSPAPVVTQDIMDYVTENVANPLINELKQRGIIYKGIIYAGLMITDNGVKVLEFNCRFGDPETQPILYRMESDITDVISKCIEEKLDSVNIEWNEKPSVCVVISSGGYPKAYNKGCEITGIEDAETIENVKVFHAGTAEVNGKLVTSGGRVLGVTAKGDGLQNAIEKAYNAVEKIRFSNMHYRKDIGNKALGRMK
ncbi:Phosphoribosylamine--glycine ligase [Flexistipes sinusarabici DSM 4947]|uniref:Phosphoribosylamine--glycine ligase n=2 Tax=Flexistipes sinusarabici TaxID=2352 RepID=F8E4H9_FLESM|nr:phosphoribosylamine--glycine ligase [Flexistipes sinusarabici]AEI14465.1 Phosphoribosylamine--glycine ligase [Flexistipes sinusarabici DSM 4947]